MVYDRVLEAPLRAAGAPCLVPEQPTCISEGRKDYL